MTKKNRKLELGDNVKETSIVRTGRKRVGEIISILSDSKSDPTIECIVVDPKELTPIEDAFGNHKTFNEKDSISFQPTNVERQSYALVKLYEEQFLLNKFNEDEIDVSVARIFGCFSERAKSKGFYGGGHFPI